MPSGWFSTLPSLLLLIHLVRRAHGCGPLLPSLSLPLPPPPPPVALPLPAVIPNLTPSVGGFQRAAAAAIKEPPSSSNKTNTDVVKTPQPLTARAKITHAKQAIVAPSPSRSSSTVISPALLSQQQQQQQHSSPPSPLLLLAKLAVPPIENDAPLLPRIPQIGAAQPSSILNSPNRPTKRKKKTLLQPVVNGFQNELHFKLVLSPPVAWTYCEPNCGSGDQAVDAENAQEVAKESVWQAASEAFKQLALVPPNLDAISVTYDPKPVLLEELGGDVFDRDLLTSGEEPPVEPEKHLLRAGAVAYRIPNGGGNGGVANQPSDFTVQLDIGIRTPTPFPSSSASRLARLTADWLVESARARLAQPPILIDYNMDDDDDDLLLFDQDTASEDADLLRRRQKPSSSIASASSIIDATNFT